MRLKTADRTNGCCLFGIFYVIFGVIFNVLLKKNVWDYSKMPLNLGGQICVLYSFFWAIISIVFIPFAAFVSKRLNADKKTF